MDFFSRSNLSTILKKLSYVVVLLVVTCLLNPSMILSHLPDGSACDAHCLAGKALMMFKKSYDKSAWNTVLGGGD